MNSLVVTYGFISSDVVDFISSDVVFISSDVCFISSDVCFH